MAIVSAIDKQTRKRNAVLLGGLLQVARDEMGLKQAELAKRLGVHQSFVSKYESGQRFLDLTEFIRICWELSADPAELIKQLEEKGVGFGR